VPQDDDEGRAGRSQPSPQNTGSASGQDELAARLGELARSLQGEKNTEETLSRIISAAVDLIPGVQEASVSVVTGRREVRSRAATSGLPERVDGLQMETGEGPCLDAVYEQQTVRVNDMSAEERWPRFASGPTRPGRAACCPSSSTSRGTTSGR
jgi:hypothetical protein